MATVVTEGLLRELAAFRATSGCAISIYVDFDPSTAPTVPAEKAKFHSRVDEAKKEADAQARERGRDCRYALEADFERLKAWGDEEFDRDGARSLAVFASSADGLFRIVPLVESVTDGWEVGPELWIAPPAGPPRGGGGGGAGGGGSGLLDGVDCFVELHVEQGRDLVDRGHAIGVASRIWPHGRYRVDITGTPNHAGTTRMEDRHDPMLTYAMTALAANKQARITGQRATFGRLETTPNSTNSVPAAVTAWMDVRCESDEQLAELVATITRQAEERADRDGTTLTVTAESVSGSTEFDADLAPRIAADHADDWPVIPTQAGHDAGILSAQGIPSAMLFVRNPTGVSHSPAEHAEVADCLAGVDALAETLEQLAT